MNSPHPGPATLLAPELEDYTLLEFAAPLPEGLRSADAQTQATCLALLTDYHVAAARLERHLQDVLPSLEDYTCDQLRARIQADLGLDIDAEQIILDVPVSVSRAYEIDPQFGRVKSYAAPWVASKEREQFSLGQLARRNFAASDEHMAARLSLADSDLDQPLYAQAGLDASYLHRIIPQLNVAQGYRNLLRSVFHLPLSMPGDESAPVVQAQQRKIDLLLQPYEHQIVLESFCAVTCRRLTDEGYRIMMRAALARSRIETDAAHLEMNWIVFKAGHAVSGEGGGHTLSGLCAVRDRSSGRTVLYLPDAPADLNFIEGETPEQARSRLIQRLISHAELVEYLSERTLDDTDRAHHASYIRQALIRGFEGFIDFVPAVDLQLSALQLSTRADALYRMTEARSRSTFDLDRAASRQQNAHYLAYLRALLGLLPGIGTVISVQDAWHDGIDAVQSFHQGRLDQGLLAAGSAALSVLDVMLSAVPGAVSVRVLARYGGRARTFKPVGAARSHEIRPFEGYEVDKYLGDAKAQSGRDAGTFLQDGDLWIQREGLTYPVYRRSAEQTLRLKRSGIHGYEPPVRFENGVWVYHTDVGLKGGVKSAIAETLIAKAHADPAFTRRHARQLLDDFDFPPDRQCRLEIDLAIDYEKNRNVPAWAEAYRRAQPSREAASLPGPSGVKRRPDTLETSDAKRTPTGSTSTQGSATSGPDAWQSWGHPLGDGAGIERTDAIPPVFRQSGRAQAFIEMNGLRYDVLPGGGSPSSSTVFLAAPNSVDQSLTGLNKAIRASSGQPVMASFFNGTWTVHGPLFKRAVHELIEQHRAGLTPASYRVLAEKLFELGDKDHAGWTATRLINMKAALNAWREGGQARLPVLSDPLLMLEGARIEPVKNLHASLKVGTGPSLRTFNRLDFQVNEPALVEKLIVATTEDTRGIAGRTSLRELMSALLVRAGYSMLSPDDAMLSRKGLMLFQREGLEGLYLLKLRRFSNARPTLKVPAQDSPLPMSNRWLDEWMADSAQEPVISQLEPARSQGRLIRLIGGIKITSAADGGKQVFVQRIADDL